MFPHFSIASLYCHPLEHVLSNLVPALAGPIILQSHIMLTWFWVALVIFFAVLTHSGEYSVYIVLSSLTMWRLSKKTPAHASVNVLPFFLTAASTVLIHCTMYEDTCTRVIEFFAVLAGSHKSVEGLLSWWENKIGKYRRIFEASQWLRENAHVLRKTCANLLVTALAVLTHEHCGKWFDLCVASQNNGVQMRWRVFFRHASTVIYSGKQVKHRVFFQRRHMRTHLKPFRRPYTAASVCVCVASCRFTKKRRAHSLVLFLTHCGKQLEHRILSLVDFTEQTFEVIYCRIQTTSIVTEHMDTR